MATSDHPRPTARGARPLRGSASAAASAKRPLVPVTRATVEIRKRLRQLPHRSRFIVHADAACRVIRAVRRWFRLRPRNDDDPILMVPLRDVRGPVFKHVSPSGVVTGFEARTLHRYLATTGHFVNPITRGPISIVELRRLDRLVCAAPTSGAGARRGPDPLAPRLQALRRRRREELERTAMVEFLTTDLGNEVTTALETVRVTSSYSRLIAVLRLRGPVATALHGALYSLAMVSHRTLEEAYRHECARVQRVRNHVSYDDDLVQGIASLMQTLYLRVRLDVGPSE